MSQFFKYHTRDVNGATRDDTIEALDEQDAVKKLQEQGLVVISVEKLEQIEIENRTPALKEKILRLEALKIDDYPDMQELSSNVKKVLELSKAYIADAKNIKKQMKEQFEAYKNRFPDLPEEKARNELGVSRFEIEEVINSNEDNENYEKIIAVSKRAMEYQYGKTKFFSEDRKIAKNSVKSLINARESFEKCFNLLDKALNTVNNKIRINQIKKGDISILKEITNVPLLLSKDEKCYIKIDGVELYEDRAVRETTGGYGGFSFRVAKGVYARVGSFSGRGESHMEKRRIDTGAFYVTNKRYIYDGSSKNIEGELKKIISVEAYSDGIKISRANKRDEVYVGAIDGEYVGAVISGIIRNIA